MRGTLSNPWNKTFEDGKTIYGGKIGNQDFLCGEDLSAYNGQTREWVTYKTRNNKYYIDLKKTIGNGAGSSGSTNQSTNPEGGGRTPQRTSSENQRQQQDNGEVGDSYILSYCKDLAVASVPNMGPAATPEELARQTIAAFKIIKMGLKDLAKIEEFATEARKHFPTIQEGEPNNGRVEVDSVREAKISQLAGMLVDANYSDDDAQRWIEEKVGSDWAHITIPELNFCIKALINEQDLPL